MKKKAKIVIIGAGISGLSIAYNLAKKGMKDIVVLDQFHFLAGSTSRCGAGVRQQWATALNCILAKKSIEFFSHANETLNYDGDIEFKQGGYLILSTSKEEDLQFEKNVKLQNSLGIPSKHLSVEEALEIVPHLDVNHFTSATYCPTDGHVNPFYMSEAYYREALRLDVDFEFFTEVKAIEMVGGRIHKVVTNRGDIQTHRVINAAGGFSKEVGEMVGLDLPVYSENHEILVTERARPLLEPMVMSFSGNIYCQQVPHGSIIMGRNNPDALHNHDQSSSWQFLDSMAKTLNHFLPEVAKQRVIRTWGGSYNISPDFQPIISDTSIPDFYVACGFSGHGFMFAPITGILISEMVLGEALESYAKDLHLDRFKNMKNIDREHSVV